MIVKENKIMKKYRFSHSQLQTANCSNKYHIKYTLKLQSKRYSKKKALSIGKLFHGGIEVMYKLASRPVSMEQIAGDAILKASLDHVRALSLQMKKHLVPDEGESQIAFDKKLDIDFGIPLVMLKAYYHHMFIHERFEIIEPEQKIIVAVRTPSGRRSPNMEYLGFLDSVIRNLSDSGIYLHEVKTAQAWTEKDELFLKIDPQTTGYHWMAGEKDIKLDGTIYTICLKPNSKPLLLDASKKAKRDAKKEGRHYEYNLADDYESVEDYLARIKKMYTDSPEKYFIRKIFTRTPEQIKRFETELYYACRHAVGVRNSRNFMQPNKMSCPMCDGYDLCQDWSKETMEKWYEPKYQDDEIDFSLITLN